MNINFGALAGMPCHQRPQVRLPLNQYACVDGARNQIVISDEGAQRWCGLPHLL